MYVLNIYLPLHESGMSSSAGQATSMYALYAWKNMSSASSRRAVLNNTCVICVNLYQQQVY